MTRPRSFLYVPGHRPDRFAKAVGSGADAVILDLEDAVPLNAKAMARDSVVEFLSAAAADDPVQRWVRLNSGDLGDIDLAALAGLTGLHGLVVPKAASSELARLQPLSGGASLIALVETATAFTELAHIAAVPGVEALAVGEVDLAADLGFGDDAPEAMWWALRTQVVVASAACGLAPPIGPVTRDVADLAGLRTLAGQLRAGGFGSVQAIHPTQVAVVNETFTLPAAERTRLERIVQMADDVDGAVFVDDDGQMIDEAVLRSIRRLLGT